MTQLKIARWFYVVACISAGVAFLFRIMFLFAATTPAGVNICETTSLRPSSFLEFSVLCFVFSIASQMQGAGNSPRT